MFLNLDLDDTKDRNDKQEYYMKRAAIVATYSNTRNHRHGCVIVNRRTEQIIAEGYNHFSEHMMHTFSCHSEVDALMKIRKYPKHLVHELDLYVVRIGTDRMGNPLKYSKPCIGCTQAILKAGIRKVYFSTDENFTNKIKEFKQTACKSSRMY